eukprot:764089-Hanusia_phi.AAC.9
MRSFSPQSVNSFRFDLRNSGPLHMTHQTRVDRMTVGILLVAIGRIILTLWQLTMKVRWTGIENGQRQTSSSDQQQAGCLPWGERAEICLQKLRWQQNRTCSQLRQLAASDYISVPLHCLSRIDRIKLQKMAKQAEAEEKVHSKRSGFLNKTMIYNDRNRFRCIGTPLLDSEERDSMLFRSTRRFDDKENRLPTPIMDTFHAYESPMKTETVLKRHSVERPAWNAGMHRTWHDMKERAARGDQSARRINVVGYGSRTSLVFSKEAPEKDELRDVAGYSPRPSSRLSTGRLYDHRRPIAEYGKLIYGGRTILVPMTANQPHGQRIFLDTHYNGWVGQAVGSR